MNPESQKPTGNYRNRHHAGRKVAISGIFVGLFLLMGCTGLAIYRSYWHHKGFVQGRFSAGSIESIRQRISQIPPSTENIGKIADYVFRRLSADAELLKDSWSDVATLLIMDIVVAMYIMYLSFRLKRIAETDLARDRGQG